MTANELLTETTRRMPASERRTADQAMLDFIAAEVLEYEGETVTPDRDYVEQYLASIVSGQSDEEATEIYADVLGNLGRYLNGEAR